MFCLLECAKKFNDAATKLANSKHTPAPVKAILQEMVKVVNASKQCVAKGDKDCIAKKLKADGVGGMKKAESQSTGKLRTLFGAMDSTDKQAYSQIIKQKNGDVAKLGAILCKMFTDKATKITTYLKANP